MKFRNRSWRHEVCQVGAPGGFEFQEEDRFESIAAKWDILKSRKNESFHFTIDFTFIVQTPGKQMILLLNYKTHHYTKPTQITQDTEPKPKNESSKTTL